jgi:predicted kinase
LGSDEVCFYDQLWSDCNGRISDDHETKRQNVTTWIEEFKAVVPAKTSMKQEGKVMYVLVGTVGAGKSTWTEKLRTLNRPMSFTVVSEDTYRMTFAKVNMSLEAWTAQIDENPKDQYAKAWQYCFENSKQYDEFAKLKLMEAVNSGTTLVLDRTNQSRKGRSKWISAAKAAGYRILSVEFYISENLMHERQKTRKDKDVPYHRAHQIYMNFDVPQLGVEVDGFEIVPPF